MQQVARRTNHKHQLLGAAVHEPVRLLIADDDEAHREGLSRALAESGLTVSHDEARTAADAIARLRGGEYDCVILADVLPDRGTAELVAALRADHVITPILIITDQQDDDAEQALCDAGATDCMPRGEISPRRLARRLRFVIRVGRAEAESNRALTDAVTSARARDEVLAVVSHDLRGPLNAIGLASDALRDELNSDDAKRYLGAIERAAARAERLIRDLTETIKIENGSLEIAPRPIDARALVEQARTDHEMLATENGGRIEMVLPDHPITVVADRDRMLQVFANLIGNAIKYAKGTPIALTLAERNGSVVFGVVDQGPGIPPEELPHVFDRYWQGRKKRRGGAGLGLAIAKGIIEAHRGTINVDSKVGRGTQFEFTISRPT
jgi:signal transduction histidine kinase